MPQKLKTFFKLIVCHILYYLGLIDLYLFFYKRKHKDFPCVIINYHSFVKRLDEHMEVHPTVTHKIKDFQKEIKFLKRHFSVVSLDQVAQTLQHQGKFTQPTVSITVDDGFKDNYELLFPVLQRHDATVTVFLTTGVLDTNERLWVSRLESIFLNTVRNEIRLNGIFKGLKFDISTKEKKREIYKKVVERLKNIDTQERDEYISGIEKRLGRPKYDQPLMLNWEEIRLMHKAGIHFGAHTVHHPILTNVPLAEAKKEILDSKLKIEKEVGVAVKHFAFPNGRPQDFNEDLRQYCRQLGFHSVSSCDYGHNDQSKDIWNLKRIGSEVPVSLFAFNVLRAFHFQGENNGK